MFGTLITTHGNLGDELIKIGRASCRERAIKKLDKGNGVLILTDLFGGTPSNISLSFMKEGKVEVLTGVNLPMMLKLSEAKGNMTLRDFACLVKSYGEKNIMLASEILSKKANRS